MSLQGRRAAVAIFKPKVWHSEPKHGSGKRQNPQISNRPAGTPPRRFSGSAISRGRTPAFPVRSIFHTIKDRISRRSHTRLKDEFHRAALPRLVPGCRLVPSKIAASGAKNALLAMTNLIWIAGKRNGFQNETLEKRCGASPRKNDRIKQKAAAHAPTVPVCLPEIRPFSLLLFKINKNPPRDLFKKTVSPLLTSIPVYRYTRIAGSRRQNAAFPDRQPLSPSRCRPASSFRLIFSDGLRRIDAAASMRCTRRRGCPNGRFLPTPTDSLPPPTAAVQAPGALQFPPGRRPHPIPGRFSPPSAVTKCRFGAPSALPNLSRRCAARPSFARCRAHGAAHSERKRPLFRSCAPLPGDVPPPARPIPGSPRPLIYAATPCVFFILCAVGGLHFCLLSHFP